MNWFIFAIFAAVFAMGVVFEILNIYLR